MDQRNVLAPFLRERRLTAVPRRREPRLALLDLLAGEFEPGLRYAESTVNATLAEFHPDFCLLRRLLVDEEFLARKDGYYWRTGGSVDVG